VILEQYGGKNVAAYLMDAETMHDNVFVQQDLDTLN
jgi:hypothetical protein